MSGPPVVVLVLPGPPSERDASLRSVVTEGVDEQRILDVGAWKATEFQGSALVGFIRPGDRWRPGHLNALRGALASDPSAVLSVGRHVRRSTDGVSRGEFGLGPEPPKPDELALRCPVEASAALLSPAGLSADVLSLLHRPGGDIAVWCACAAIARPAPVDVVVADVRWDRGRHGFDLSERTATLRTLAAAPVGRSGPAAAAIRRELLARLFLEGAPLPEGFDACELEGEDGLRGVIRDLQWTLEQQGRQLTALWRGWPHEPAEGDAERLEWPEDALDELRMREALWSTERAELHHRMQLLQARVRERDAYLARVVGPPRLRESPR